MNGALWVLRAVFVGAACRPCTLLPREDSCKTLMLLIRSMLQRPVYHCQSMSPSLSKNTPAVFLCKLMLVPKVETHFTWGYESLFSYCIWLGIWHNNIFIYSLNIYLFFVLSLSPAKRQFRWLHSPARETSEIFPRVFHKRFQIQIISPFPFANGGENEYGFCQLYICVFPGSLSTGFPPACSPLWCLLRLGGAETIVSNNREKFCSL